MPVAVPASFRFVRIAHSIHLGRRRAYFSFLFF